MPGPEGESSTVTPPPTRTGHILLPLVTVALGVLWLAAAMYCLKAIEAGAKFRRDLAQGQRPLEGQSLIWQVNVLDSRNYSPEGRGAHRRIVASFVTMVAAAVGFFLLLSELVT
jgi:hypothetical protein